MATRPEGTPTEEELDILKVLRERGPSTVCDMYRVLVARQQRAYTSAMSLLQIMTDKGQVARKMHGRAIVYTAKRSREKNVGQVINHLLRRAFEESVASLVAQLLFHSKPTAEELNQIRKAIDHYENGNRK